MKRVHLKSAKRRSSSVGLPPGGISAHGGEPPFTLPESSASKRVPHFLLIDEDSDHAQKVRYCLNAMGHVADICRDVPDAEVKLRCGGSDYELVIVDITNQTKAWRRLIRNLQETAHQARHHASPLFLCITRVRITPQLRLALEQIGARIAYEE